MKRLVRHLLLLSSLFIAASSYGQVAAPSAATLVDLRKVLTYNRLNPLFSAGTTPPCAGTGDCNTTASVVELFDKKQALAGCLVRASTITLVYGAHPGAGAHRKIVWALDTSDTDPTKATYAFEGPHSILIVKDTLPASTRGAGDFIDDTHVSVNHKRMIRSGKVEYYPLVVQTQSDGTKFLCAAGDPIINND